MKKLIHLFCLMVFCSSFSFGQWTAPGSQIHSGPNPVISKDKPFLFFVNTTANTYSGNVFREGVNNLAYLLYHNGTSDVTIGNTTVLADNVFAINADDGKARLAGWLNFNGTGNTKIQAEGDEMLWYDKTLGRVSWGADAMYNKFEKPINIGTTLVPEPGQALVIADAKNIAMVGDNSYIQWFASTNSDHTGASAGFVGVNPGGTMFVESNLAKISLDGEKGIDFLSKDLFRARMNSAGQWVFGGSTVDTSFRMQINGDVKINGELFSTSDARMKKNIKSLDRGLETLLALNPVSYEFKADEFQSLENQTDVQMGFLAQEIETLIPALVQTGALVSDKSGNSFQAKSMNYMQLIPLLTKAIQEQQELMDGQQNTIEKCNELIQALGVRINQLEKLNK